MGSTKAVLWGTLCIAFHTIATPRKSNESAGFMQCGATRGNASETDCGSGCRRFKSDHSPQFFKILGYHQGHQPQSNNHLTTTVQRNSTLPGPFNGRKR